VPVVVLANPNQTAIVGHPFDYDASQGGATFMDPDGDPLTYEVLEAGYPRGLRPLETRVLGPATEAGKTAMMIVASDGRGGRSANTFEINVAPNSPPAVVKPNSHQLVAVGERVERDARDAIFSDPDGDRLTYDAEFETAAHGLRLVGMQLSGVFDAVGLVRVKVTANDGFGGVTSDTFLIAAPAPEPGRPALPDPPYVYDDDQQQPRLPYYYELSRDNGPPFWDKAPPSGPSTNAIGTLGRVLFYDKRLSITNTHACGSCHSQAAGFAKPERFSIGVQGLPTRRNAMSLADVRYSTNNGFFLDDRSQGIEHTVLMPIEDPLELGQPLSLLEAKLAATDFYGPLFTAAFGTPEVTRDRIARALVQFLSSIVSYRTKFDLAVTPQTWDDIFTRDPARVFTSEELSGHELFVTHCNNCHMEDIQKVPLAMNNGLDLVSQDRGAGEDDFRPAALRNIAETGPYMHDGRFATLREVIDHYDHGVQPNAHLSSRLRDTEGQPLRLNLSETDKTALEAFLRTLSDDYLLTHPKFSDPFE
jgi:cytochrome c peroxidase